MLSWGVDYQTPEARVVTEPLARIEADGLVVALCEGQGPDPAATDPLSDALRRILELGDFAGKPKQVVSTYLAGLGAPRLALAGLGRAAELNPERIRRATGAAAARLRDLGARRIALAPPGAPEPLSWGQAAGAAVEGALLGLYQLHEFRTERREEIKQATEVVVAVPAEAAEDAARQTRDARALAGAVNWIRTLANRPGNAITARTLAEEARRMAGERGIRCRIIDSPELEALGMGCILGVGAGSAEPPLVIVLEYDGAGTAAASGGDRVAEPLALVGKGITFDTGGLHLKSRRGMEQMKDDMSGGGAVLGAIRAAADLGLPVRLVGIVPATDNMPGSAATKPGDVLRSYAGITVEVADPDAEGRLVLADGLAFAVREWAPRAVVDLATLTGSIFVALGHHGSGLFTRDDRMARILSAAGEATGERVWRMPLWPEHDDLVESDIADVRNQGVKGDSDAIAAAVFLGKFVGGVPWAHLDIAGTSWAEKRRSYVPKGATGVGVRLLVEAIRNGL